MDTLLEFTFDGHIEQLESPQGIIADISPSSHSTQLVQADNNVPQSKGGKIEANPTEDPELLDTARNTGDWTIYKHYIQSVSVWRFSMLVGAHIFSAVLDNFPSRRYCPFLSFIVLTTCPSCLVEAMVVRCSVAEFAQ